MFQNKSVGKRGEQLACDYLQANGYTILDKNFNTRYGELDIIAQKDQTLSFIEVKTRNSLDKGKPYEAVNYHKLRHLQIAIQLYMKQKNLSNSKLSLDVISILLDGDKHNLEHFKNITR